MKEPLAQPAADAALALPRSGSVDVGAGDVAWQDSGAAGFQIKPLLGAGAAGPRTSLMKIDPGAFAPMHAHAEVEQIYVIEGTFYDQEKTYHPGALIVRAPGAMHTSGSEDGALVLLVYTPPGD